MRSGVNIILPGRLFQRGNFLTWSHQQKQALLNTYDITMVVNLWRPIDSDLANRHGFVYLSAHMPGNSIPKEADQTVDYVARMMLHGKAVLVHCEAGVNRSAWFCARLLQTLGHFPAEDAIRIVQERIPRADINAALLADIRAH